MACSLAVSALYAPTPDFRYVGLEPISTPKLGVAATAFGLGAGVTLAMSGFETRQALVAGALASLLSAVALRGAGAVPQAPSGSARMAIVPWGVLVEALESPRILRWAAVRSIELEKQRARRWLAATPLPTRVVVATEHDRFVGEALGVIALERLVEHLGAYANEQATPIALGLGDGVFPRWERGAHDGDDAASSIEPSCELLLGAAHDWLRTASAMLRLGLPSAGYRHASALVPTTHAVDALRAVLRDRTPRAADPRAFAAVVAAELRARELVPELVALTQCPHPVVAAVARQAARRLGASRTRTGTLDEVAPFLFEADRASLDAWLVSGAA